MSFHLYDSHNHLQDAPLTPHLDGILRELDQQGVVKMVVNGTQEADWPAVLELTKKNSKVIPCFGLHPWYVAQRSANWQSHLLQHLEQVPAGIGEIGLDRWIEGYDSPQQEEVFIWQLRLAAERNLPVSIHCLRAWGRLLELLQQEPRPECGFLLHSYGGPQEMIESLAKLGAYFSISGYFAQERKGKQQEIFRHVPRERLLIETDAPDMLPPEKYVDFPLIDESSGKSINHPANIGAVYRFVAELLNEPIEVVAQRTEENFQRLFGSLQK
ncbi:MAG: TatD-related deoxyribonuclease [Pedosphaera sp.]|nr:TatD-related deoxyribonuclease [Pedosphaera sp.]